MIESKSSRRAVLAGAGAIAAAAVAGTPALAQEKTLTAVTALEQNNTLTISFRTLLIDKLNAAGKGNLQIKYLGAQEVVAPDKAANALRRGQFDILSGPLSYWVGQFPEAYAFLASNQGAKQLRANGGFKILQEAAEKKLGAHLLSWGGSMTSYYMFLTKPPKLKNGVPDLTGLKMRATGTYRPLFRALGATTVNIKSSELYTALERGTVDGYGFTDTSIYAMGTYKFAKYRILPNFYQTNTVELVNMDTWKALTQAQRDLLTKLAIEFETTSVHFMEAERLKEDALLKKGGMVDFVLKGKDAERYVDIAHDEIWKELKSRSPDYHDRLRSLMYIPGKPNRQDRIPTAEARLQQ